MAMFVAAKMKDFRIDACAYPSPASTLSDSQSDASIITIDASNWLLRSIAIGNWIFATRCKITSVSFAPTTAEVGESRIIREDIIAHPGETHCYQYCCC